MRIEKKSNQIMSLDDWSRLAGPKSPNQWVEGRSAFELARAWCGSGAPAMPGELRALLESRPDTSGLSVEFVVPEHRITFDRQGGEPRNADLAFIGRRKNSTVAVTVEAKADEPFGATIADTVADALERGIKNNRSRGIRRVENLVQALLPPKVKGLPHLGYLRYQLLTATAGTLAYALENNASCGVLVVHEFVTDKTKDERHAQNAQDFQAFLHRLGGLPPSEWEMPRLFGPFTVPGLPLWPSVPLILIGKVVTNRRLGA